MHNKEIIKHILWICIFIFGYACKSPNHKTETQGLNDSTLNTDSVVTKLSTQESIPNNASKVSVGSEMLHGKWQNVADPSNFLVFEENRRKEIAAGMSDWNDEVYVLSEGCNNEGDRGGNRETELQKYISCTESDMCWYILQLTQDSLTLSYVGRGNTLQYVRAL